MIPLEDEVLVGLTAEPIEPPRIMGNPLPALVRHPFLTTLTFTVASLTLCLNWDAYDSVKSDLQAGIPRAQIERTWQRRAETPVLGEIYDQCSKYGRALAFKEYKEQK